MYVQGDLGGTFENHGVNGRRISLKGMQGWLEVPVPNAATYRVNFGRLLLANKTWKETKKTHILFLFCPKKWKKKKKKKTPSGFAVNAASPSPIKARPSLDPPPPNIICLWGAVDESLPGREPHGQTFGKVLA